MFRRGGWSCALAQPRTIRDIAADKSLYCRKALCVIAPASDPLHDPVRLAALEASGLLDSLPEAAFDRFTRLATRLLGVPVSLISLLTPSRQFFKSAVGLAEPWAGARQTPLSHSFCQHVVRSGEALVVADARLDPQLYRSLAIPDLDVIAYAGFPLLSAEGAVLGAFCAIDAQPRLWNADDLALLADLAASVSTEIQLRQALARQHEIQRAFEANTAALRQSEGLFRAVAECLREGLLITDPEDRVIYANERMAELSGYGIAEMAGRPAHELFLPPEDWPLALARNQRRMQGVAEEYSLQANRRDGSRWRATVSAAPLQDANGVIIGTLGVVMDTTERYRSEEALQTMIGSRERLIAELRSNLTRTEALYQLGRSLTSLESLDALLQKVVDSAATALPADRVSVIILDVVAQRVRQVVRGGSGRDQVEDVDFAELAQGLTGWVLREQQPALSPKESPDLREGARARQRRTDTVCGAIMVAPLIHREQVFGTITAINRPDERDFTADDLELLVTMASQAATAIANAHLFQEVQEQAITDSLTGFYNRRGFFTRGDRALVRAALEGRPLALIMLDIDHFKHINDRYGHAAGDAVLRAVAARCQANTRTSDLLARLGGDEFALLLPHASLALARQIAERIRAAVADNPITTATGVVAVTLSLGVALPADGDTGLEALLIRADNALYTAKAAGRNRVMCWDRAGVQ